MPVIRKVPAIIRGIKKISANNQLKRQSFINIKQTNIIPYKKPDGELCKVRSVFIKKSDNILLPRDCY